MNDPKMTQFPKAHGLYTKLIAVVNENRKDLTPYELIGACYAVFVSALEWAKEINYPFRKELTASALEMLCNTFLGEEDSPQRKDQ